MKVWIAVSVLLISVISSGCSVKSPVVIPQLQHTKAAELNDSIIALHLDKKLLSEKYEVKQLLTVFEYELGEYFKAAIPASLKSSFPNILITDSEAPSENFNFIVKPELVFFHAPVPPLVTMNTKTIVRVQYHVKTKDMNESFTLAATGSYELDDQSDKEIYDSLSGQDFYYYDTNSSIGLNIPSYSYEAGKDAYMAIYHALEDLKKQLIEKLKNS